MSSLILSIEDEACVTDVIEQTLTVGGFEVVSAIDAEHAIEFMQSKTPDLILLDLMLPDIAGYSFFELVRVTSKTRNIPIMIVSGCVSDEAEALGLKMGASDYLRKPFAPEDLLARVNRVLDSRQRDGVKPARHGSAQR
jgi:two-component system, OmpR family, phosphate regulon response regulator PhoB